GWAYSAFPGGLPTRAQLDAVLSDRPAFLVSYDGHAGWANSAAVVAARLTGITADPPDGVIVRDASGEPSGVFKERAQWLVSRVIPPPATDEKERALKRGLERLAARGITGVHDANLEPEDLELLESIETQRMLKVRVYAALPMVLNPGPDVVGRYAALREKYTGPRLRVGAVKAIVDGVVEARTAAFCDPYPGGGNGLLRWSAEDLRHAVTAFEKERLQVFAHAIGDRAIDLVLRTFEQSGGGPTRRHRIEHVEVPRLADLARFKA